MSIDNPKYDVAISFLSKDSHTAAALNDKLSEGLNVFFFPRKQEDLAGTDGLESMREPFYDNSRVMVVLFSGGWGETPWTRVEETAIKDACLAFGWHRLFFLVLDQPPVLPRWLPDSRSYPSDIRLRDPPHGKEFYTFALPLQSGFFLSLVRL